jgi:predicted RNase H-like nuclease (RuvC/YqgF family)
LNKKNQEFTQLQKENIDKLTENKNLKKQLEKKSLKKSEYIEKISEYQKQIEINDKDINNKNSEIISLTDNLKNNKILIKSLETEIEKLKYE